MVKRLLKAGIDRVGAATLLIVLLPVLIGISVAIFLTMGPPILFLQRRAGYREKVFWILKFRTMRKEKTEDNGPEVNRLTALGKFLRRFSLDELPQLVNVLRGEMSLVGPRPQLEKYLPRYSLEQRKRHTVLPGMTGLAQISGRNSLSWEEKFALDVHYVENWTLSMDIKILIKTVAYVILGEGIQAGPSTIMTEFEGESDPSKGKAA